MHRADMKAPDSLSFVDPVASSHNMSSAFKSFAVSGVQGAIGEAVLQGLTSTPGVSVLVLTRKTTPRPEWLPKEVAHAGIDYDDVQGTASILRKHKVEVVISLGSGIIQQIPLADAAKAAGVQLFVPSEFGTVSKGFPLEEAPPFLAPKIQVAGMLSAWSNFVIFTCRV